MKSLVALSGGLDSVYALWKELQFTSNDVTAVYFDSGRITFNEILMFSMKGFYGPGENEGYWQSCQQLASAIEPLTRPFNLVRMYQDISYVNASQVQYNSNDVMFTALATNELNNGNYDRFVTGHCRDNDGFMVSRSPSWRPGTATSLCRQYFQTHATRGEIAFPLYDMNYNKAYALVELPQSILDVQITVAPSRDLSTFKYAMRTYVSNLLVESYTPAQIYDIIGQKSTMPNNMWRSARRWMADEIPEYQAELDVDWPMPVWSTGYVVP